MPWKVKFFQTNRGDYPVKDFVEKQNLATQTKITHSIDLLINYGPFLKPPYIKKLQNKIHELRISGKPPIRIFYTLSHNKYYLVHAFKKKSQKTPTKEIKVALDRIMQIT